MRVSPAFGVLEVSRVAIGGNLTRLSKSWSGVPNPSVTDANPGQAVVNRARLVAVGARIAPLNSAPLRTRLLSLIGVVQALGPKLC